MRIADTDPHDAAVLAAEIRALARQAHALRNTPAPDPREVHALLSRMTQVEARLSDSQAVSLQRWLKNLRRDLRLCNARSQAELATF